MCPPLPLLGKRMIKLTFKTCKTTTVLLLLLKF
jgi:hypothetical protein